MSKFIYRMQNILNLKIKIEEQAKMDFAAARMRLDKEEEKLKILILRKAEYEDAGRRLREECLSVKDIMENKYAISVLEEYADGQRVHVKVAERELESAREKLQEIMQERKVQEKLREKAFEAFVIEENSKESKEIDELVSYRYGQKRR